MRCVASCSRASSASGSSASSRTGATAVAVQHDRADGDAGDQRRAGEHARHRGGDAFLRAVGMRRPTPGPRPAASPRSPARPPRRRRSCEGCGSAPRPRPASVRPAAPARPAWRRTAPRRSPGDRRRQGGSARPAGSSPGRGGAQPDDALADAQPGAADGLRIEPLGGGQLQDLARAARRRPSRPRSPAPPPPDRTSSCSGAAPCAIVSRSLASSLRGVAIAGARRLGCARPEPRRPARPVRR